jgi:peptidoglycan/xylan/chitin deacetylase (PgdA/CDA1 family)
LIDAFLHVCRFLGLFAWARRTTRHRLRILCYHGIWMGPAPHFGDRVFMDPALFAHRMNALKRAGYTALPLAEAWQRCQEGRLNGREIVITIDDGWAGTALHMAPVLARLGWPSTLYLSTHDFSFGAPIPPVTATWLLERATQPLDPRTLLGQETAPDDWATALEERIRALPEGLAQEAEWTRWGAALGVDVPAVLACRSLHPMTPAELRQCLDTGMDVQLHTHHHDLGDMRAIVIERELALNREHLASLTGRPPAAFQHFCYPSGVHDKRAFATLRQSGIQTATTTDYGLPSGRHEPMALPRILDGQSMSDIALEARLSGFWYWVDRLRGRVTGGA